MKLSKLEAIRGFASFYVVCHHSLTSLTLFSLPIGIIFKFGQEAVILFFLLSGFVINYSFQIGKNKTFKVFFLKRFTRIYIPLLFVFFLSYLLASFQAGGFIDPKLKTLILNLLMLQDIPSLKPNVITPPYMNNAPLWSLSYEWWFYMLFFLIYKLFSNKEQKDLFVFLLTIVSTITYIFYPNEVSRILMYFSIWWTGVYLSDIFLSKRRYQMSIMKLPIISLLIINVLLLINVINQYLSGHIKGFGVYPFLELRHHLFALIAILLAIFWYRKNWIGFDVLFGKFIYIAPVSYVIYISHYIFFLKKDFIFPIHSNLIQFLGILLITILFAYIVEIKFYPYFKGLVLRATKKPNN